MECKIHAAVLPVFCTWLRSINFITYQNKMNKEKISIATICWARNGAEENLLRLSLQALARLNIPVFITDGGSSDSFLSFLKTIPHFTVLQAAEKGVQAQATTSLFAAAENKTPFVFYTEPDKKAFFKDSLEIFLQNAPGDESTGVYLAARSADGYATFPPFQQMTETTINNCCAEVMGKSFDFTYGPFLMNAKLIPTLQDVKDIGWGWRPYVFVMAHRLGLSVDAWVQNFVCPPDQRADDTKERLYRMRQLEQNIRGIVMAAAKEL
ncbi:MAG TPA: hypothetical protein VMR70_10695 [Flavisolibacter sp.]|nr:hypothetical protein [Flavisolibacter sp.]